MSDLIRKGTSRGTLKDLILLFLRLGTLGFGGPAAHIAMMEDEVVRRRGWLSRQEFLDLLAATHLIPGPNSTEMAIHIGHRRAGWPGLVAAGLCFILPAAFMVGAIAWAYVRYGSLPQANAVLYGVKPVVLAVVLQALWQAGWSPPRTGFFGHSLPISPLDAGQQSAVRPRIPWPARRRASIIPKCGGNRPLHLRQAHPVKPEA